MSESKPTFDGWSTLAADVDALLDAAPQDRAGLIESLSAGDARRRAELAALLAECEREPAWLSAPAAERFSALLDEDVGRPDRLVGGYRLTRELGRGGMATVYLAQDIKHGRDVAVKVLRPAVAASLGPARFLREIAIVARLRHPNIVPLFDSGESEGMLYYVMPHEAGSSLRQRLARDGPLPIDETIQLLGEVCEALVYAHAHGVVHRDIKPDNVLLSGRHALVTDFGIAKAVLDSSIGAISPEQRSAPNDRDLRGVLETSGVALGTPAYMAPEQIAGTEPVDHRADIYALGALAYELLAGRPPFVEENRQAMLAAHLADVPSAVTTHRPDVPAPLADIIMRCLAKRPADRWQSAADLFGQLASLAVKLGAAPPSTSWRSRWSRMRIERITDFPGSEVDAAISADGRFVAFLSDRDGVFDAFVTETAGGPFVNLTGGRVPELFNTDVQNIGFTPDGQYVWIRVAGIESPASVALVPIGGGPLCTFLPSAVMAAWSRDGRRLAYHELAPGDPIFLAEGDGTDPRQRYVAPAGIHSHHLEWSPDERFLYCAHGTPPNEMDVWRIPTEGGAPERITTHASRVGYPTLLDDRTLVYTATDGDGNGPWLFLLDLEERVPVRLGVGVERFISIAAADGIPGRPRRLATTVSNPSAQLWSVPLDGEVAGEEQTSRVTVPTARSAAPRFARDGALLYLASRGGADGLWRLTASAARELFRPNDGALLDAPSVSPNGDEICVAVRRGGRSTLWCMDADGTNQRPLAGSLDVRGAPSWSPDGQWIAITARIGSSVRLFKIPVDGAPPILLVDAVSSNPAWSPAGRFIVYSGTPRGRSVPLHAVTADGARHPLPFESLTVDRLGDSYRFTPDGSALVVKLGGFRREDFWLVDLATGARRQLTRLRQGESVQRFDVAPDGTRIVFERVRENSDIAVIELPGS